MLNELYTMVNEVDKWKTYEQKMPVLFVGHGAPFFALGNNEYSRQWKKLGEQLPRPNAIVSISAHWLTKGTYVHTAPQPRTIYDFKGFQKELYQINYDAPGQPTLAEEISANISSTNVFFDTEWGLDHGTWCVLVHMYPNADIPVLQLSIDYDKPASYHYELAKELSFLRSKGVLVLCSGNIVHNLQLIDMNHDDPFDWAVSFDETVVNFIDSRNYNELINYQKLGMEAKLSIPTPDHYYPLIYSLGLSNENDLISYPVKGFSLRSTSMRSVLFSPEN